MSDARTWILTDVDTRTWLDALDVDADTCAVDAGEGWSIRKRTLHGGLTEGVDIVDVDNGALSFTVLPTRGMGVWKGSYQGCALGWDAPVKGPVNPMFVDALDRGGLGWLQGFDEWIVRCGLASNGAPGKDVVLDNNGNEAEAELALHGRIANLPANHVEVTVRGGDSPLLSVSGVVDEAALFYPQLRLKTTISTVPGSNTLTVSDEVINMQSVDAELELLYHCNFGPPFLDGGGVLVAPSCEVAPRDARAAEDTDTYATYLPPTPGYVEQVYWHDLRENAKGETLAMLRNAAGDRGAVLRYRKSELPCFAQWKNTAGTADGYVTGLEPGTNLPNLKTFERKRGRVVVLAPGASYRASFAVEVHDTAAGVQGVQDEIESLTGSAVPVLHAAPVSKWSDV